MLQAVATPRRELVQVTSGAAPAIGARSKLSGAPLASWRHLMAMPIPGVQSLVLLARGPVAPPFGEPDLAGIAGPVAEASGLLRTALRTRELARLLAAMRDDDRPGLG